MIPLGNFRETSIVVLSSVLFLSLLGSLMASVFLDWFSFGHCVFCHVSSLVLVAPLSPLSACSSADGFNCCHLCLPLISHPHTVYFSCTLILWCARLSDVLHLRSAVIVLSCYLRIHVSLSVCISLVLLSWYSMYLKFIRSRFGFSFNLQVLLLHYSQWFLLRHSHLVICIRAQLCLFFIESHLSI